MNKNWFFNMRIPYSVWNLSALRPIEQDEPDMRLFPDLPLLLTSTWDSDVHDASCTLVEKEMRFITRHLREVRVQDESCYGFMEGTEEQKEDFLEQFCLLNSTKFVRSRAEVKEKTHKTKTQTGIGVVIFNHPLYIKLKIGHYMFARGYEFYLLVLNSVFLA